jgi:ribosomal 30S subunit maturation factor RimM
LAGGGNEFVPFTDPIVPVVDIAAGRIVVNLPRDTDS